MSLWDKPILREFVAAGRLVNEWRDTLSYGVGLVICAGYIKSTGDWGGVPVALGGAALREYTRALSWMVSREPRMAGYDGPPDHNAAYMNSANGVGHVLSAAVSALIAVIDTSLDGGVLPEVVRWSFLQTSLLCSGFSLSPFHRVGGMGAVARNYARYMWDYPRKKGGGGTTQTQCFVNGVKRLVGRTSGDFVAAPVVTRSLRLAPCLKT